MGSVADAGEAAVGARGLTGTGYSGHVFWDADAFVLPVPGRHRTRRRPGPCSSTGCDGFRPPWPRRGPWAARGPASRGSRPATGEDVTPTSVARPHGQVVPIRTGQLEEHIVAQVPLAADTYVEWSGDRVFERGPYRDLLVETARYWASRIRVGRRRHRPHLRCHRS